MWHIDDALRLVRALQPNTRQFGYHLTMGGGVLNKGESNKDLDLYFLPMGGFDGDWKTKSDPSTLLTFLESLWGPNQGLANSITEEIANGLEELNSDSAYRKAVKFLRNGKERIDCFIF